MTKAEQMIYEYKKSEEEWLKNREVPKVEKKKINWVKVVALVGAALSAIVLSKVKAV